MDVNLAGEFNRGTMDSIMKHLASKLLGLATLWVLSAPPVLAELPRRDLTVEMRQVEEIAGVAVSTQLREPMLAPQQIRVRNGAKASLRLGQSMPVQWVQAASARGTVVHAVTWMDAGQVLTVQPRWPGAKQAVTVEIEVQSAAVGDRVGTELPTQSRSHLATTVRAPLGQWVTMATTGGSPQRGVYSSEATSESRRLIQLRVLAP